MSDRGVTGNINPGPGNYTPPDPVHEENSEWWFWDETWADRVGPYASEQAARDACDEYARQLDRPGDAYPLKPSEG